MTALADMPPTLTVVEAGKVLRIGRSAAYAAARTGDLALLDGRMDEPSDPTNERRPAGQPSVSKVVSGDHREAYPT